MITNSNAGHHDTLRPRAGTMLVASLDVEWTKNYRIRGGNIPFCYSALYLRIPTGRPVDLAEVPFTYTSAYVEDAAETGQLIASATKELVAVFSNADLLVGHQFTSDLATLANALPNTADATTGTDDISGALTDARHRWRARHNTETGPQIIDTRYDTGHALATTSRRLVDVCTDLRMDVTQPELRGSMTAMHRRWLETGETELRERISVLNLRHSLSAALVALRTRDLGRWEGTLHVNRILHTGLAGTFGWLSHPTFTTLLEQ